jgi:hypothetical protein
MKEYSDTEHKMTDKAIKCNHCGSTAAMAIICQGKHVYVVEDEDWGSEDWAREWQVLLCTNCDKVTVIQVSHSSVDEILEYIHGNLISTRVIDEVFLYPNGDFTIPNPHSDMPEEIAKDYNEAKVVFPFSAKSSAALLRLAIQKLCKHLGEKGENINNDIKSLVQKGLPSHIQQALDIVRVIGNQSVHPSEINISDTPEIAKKLFELVNEIVDDRIRKINKQVEINKLYTNLPEKKLEEIRKRDGKGSIP